MTTAESVLRRTLGPEIFSTCRCLVPFLEELKVCPVKSYVSLQHLYIILEWHPHLLVRSPRCSYNIDLENGSNLGCMFPKSLFSAICHFCLLWRLPHFLVLCCFLMYVTFLEFFSKKKSKDRKWAKRDISHLSVLGI